MQYKHYPSKRKDAIAQGLNSFYTSKLCIHGHDALRATSNGGCRECSRIYHRERARINRKTPEYKAYQREYHKAYRLTTNGKARLEAATERWLQKRARENNEEKEI